ncbi:MAG: type II toxin-antitoxin system HipA family toxin [Actinomycetota bacterium]|jgi:serine/threonine-protein kinase HipA|nr:type II toxin-antitoxin system HipA family toxin [Actinomycetota bacterium]
MAARRGTKELHLMMGDRLLGVLVQTADTGRLELKYDDAYLSDESATPLSISMPKAPLTYRDRALRPFLLGLLPDNDQILQRWGARFGVSWHNPFALLAEVGEDVAGAVRFIRPERLKDVSEDSVAWLDDKTMERLLRQVRLDPGGWVESEDDRGRFSLAGAQSKIALLREDGRWGLPNGQLGTTHILKVADGRFADQETVEFVTMRAARLVGLPVASVELTRFGEEVALVVERYDRLRDEFGRVERIHQEDLCQALGVLPDVKYEREGGPGVEAVVRLLRQNLGNHADAAVERFIDALIFNWLVAGTDAHAKNYALLLYGPLAELAPLYDLTSNLPYQEPVSEHERDSRLAADRNGMKMAMSIGGENTFRGVGRPEWQRLCARISVDLDRVMGRIDEMSSQLPDAVAAAAAEATVVAASASITKLVDRAATHVAATRRAIGLEAHPPAERTSRTPREDTAADTAARGDPVKEVT